MELLFDLTPAATVLYDPVRDAADAVVDFTFARLNPAAQRLLGLPEHPTTTYLQQFPDSVAAGLWAFHREAFLAADGQPHERRQAYRIDNYDGLFQGSAQRVGQQLLVSFFDTQEQARAQAEQQARQAEAARQAAEHQRSELERLFEQAPVAIAIFRGPGHVIELANDLQLALWGRTREQALGRGLFELLPDVAGQGFEERLAGVLATGTPFVGTDVPTNFVRHGQSAQLFVSFVYAPLYAADGRIDGVMVVVTDTTTQVVGRQRVEQLNQELEARVHQRTQEAEAARAAAERQQALLQALFEQAPVAIALFQGEEVRVASANPRMAAFWGRTPAQVVGKLLLEAVPELQGQGFEMMIAEVHRSGVPYVNHEAPAQIMQDGRLVNRYYNFSCQPIYDAQGGLLGVINVATEVTEQVESRHRIEELNQELEARVQQRTHEVEAAHAAAEYERGQLRRTLSQVPAYVATFSGPHHTYSYFNQAYLHTLTQGRAQLGQPVETLFPELVAQGFIEVLDQVYAGGQEFATTETPILLLDPVTNHERTLYLNVMYRALHDEQGQTGGLLAFATDVTEQVLARRQAEAMQAALLGAAQRQARQRQELFQIFEQTPVAIVLLREPDHRIDYFNSAFAGLFPPEQWTGGPLQGHRLEQVYPRIRAAGLAALLDRVYRTGRGEVVAEMPLGVLQPGSPRYVTFAYQAYREEEAIVGVAAFIYDVTEQVLARQQVQQLNDELTQTNQQLTRTNVDLDTFVYTASHDLKTPITNIEGILLALREMLPPAVQQDAMIAHLLALLDDTVGRFQFTIAQLTDLSRLQQLHAGPAEPVDLAAVVESVRLDLAPALVAASAQLTVNVPPGLRVSFAPANLRSIVYNLLSNAVKYRAPDRAAQVWVRAYPAGPGVLLEVQDNGLGLSETQQGRLFGLFQRLHTHVEGTGVGLYITKRLVENGGGTIAVESRLGVGTTFTVQFSS